MVDHPSKAGIYSPRAERLEQGSETTIPQREVEVLRIVMCTRAPLVDHAVESRYEPSPRAYRSRHVDDRQAVQLSKREPLLGSSSVIPLATCRVKTSWLDVLDMEKASPSLLAVTARPSTFQFSSAPTDPEIARCARTPVAADKHVCHTFVYAKLVQPRTGFIDVVGERGIHGIEWGACIVNHEVRSTRIAIVSKIAVRDRRI